MSGGVSVLVTACSRVTHVLYRLLVLVFFRSESGSRAELLGRRLIPRYSVRTDTLPKRPVDLQVVRWRHERVHRVYDR